MDQIIIVDGEEIVVSNWREGPLSPSPAGEHPDAQDDREKDAANRGFEVLRQGEVAFNCPQVLAIETAFSLSEGGRNFVVTSSGNPRHRAIEK